MQLDVSLRDVSADCLVNLRRMIRRCILRLSHPYICFTHWWYKYKPALERCQSAPREDTSIPASDATFATMAPPVTEGEVPFRIPGVDKEVKTWYKVVGDLQNRTRPPLVILHGGPGFSHDYLIPLQDLAEAPYSIAVVFYDQVGGGRSTHLPEKKGDESFWTEALFESEFHNLLKHLGIDGEYDVLGHSWGGMLAERLASKHPKGLRKLVLTNSLADMPTWSRNARELLKQLPQEIQVSILNTSSCRHCTYGATPGHRGEARTSWDYRLPGV